ncbi:bifunctional hydroxymethylpyrimidine kinase/phosphomethylpyrimidine kinase [Zavarzinia aquatilis]|uniref:hydroxymethylpyrimidine kinase n=1 Tax=Zavarzinia aquatilis TaxID=2211142 RepID=A0A317E8S5_9PROT|nr:bifunctional hydroxymethylpyrimidine kinase/phosphomethylpyrimidine kinase [Zavarzinia aquatilis]PWR22606.1 bifunctional hydroxymethylpyrimidine kinase/phosphomethylpyrimidine kinase [Zavarzinia aquatilis]
MTKANRGRVLIVAGSDSGGGAGIQADIKTVTALGGYAMTAITALTIQDTLGVHGIVDIPSEAVTRQMAVCLDDIGADAVKTGMLHSVDTVDAVLAGLDRASAPNLLVVDPVMVAKGGTSLTTDATVEALRTRLIPRASVITPNLPEASVLLGRPVTHIGDMDRAAFDLLALGCGAVLLKGGHLDGELLRDVLVVPEGLVYFDDPRIATTSTHGTGCTLASAIATGLAQGLDLVAAVKRARAYVRRALATAPGLGQGHGPLNHGHTVQPFGL